jgi:hypothetical protein
MENHENGERPEQRAGSHIAAQRASQSNSKKLLSFGITTRTVFYLPFLTHERYYQRIDFKHKTTPNTSDPFSKITPEKAS